MSLAGLDVLRGVGGCPQSSLCSQMRQSRGSPSCVCAAWIWNLEQGNPALVRGHLWNSSLPLAELLKGFGPFGEHAVNASWIAVQELEKLGLRDDVDLHVYEVPVEYQTVQRLIPALWKKHSPQLVVHVGVSGMATTVTLEKCGHNVGYKGLDNCRFCPGSQCCVEGGPECIDSIIDMDAVSSRVSALGLDVTVTISKDAGRYLCDFTYYTSLYQSHGRSAFVHVPPLGKPYSAEQLGRALQAIIEEMLDFLEHSEDKINCQHEH
ncbi:pyroglutamyl-peptidase 1 [Geospiza fortis]|uniref:Pyroglutamyl-peptidase I n=2 Tax=Thraupidae TaxID=400783 RepID=A0A8N5F2X9_GEOFO|nr:pyroglutamyl-peptidase 1 [Geospiza fortis]